jgi:hypothetical protein
MTGFADSLQFQRRMKRKAACEWLAERLGCGVSSATIRRWPIPYLVLGRDASYAMGDLERFAKHRLESATNRMPLPKP